MTNLHKPVLTLTILLLAFVPLALAQGTYTQIDYPGAIDSYCYGIDAAGDISGDYLDADYNAHGFVLSGGVYTVINYPGATSTIVYGINDVGQVVGFYSGSLGHSGFVYSIQTGTFTDFSYPGAGQTYPFSINNSGAIVGYAQKVGQQDYIGFKYAHSIFRRLVPPGATSTEPYGIAASGLVVGNAGTSTSGFAFSFKRGKYQKISVPGIGAAGIYGISSKGHALVGEYEPSGEILGFVYQNQTTQTLQFGTALTTSPYGVNEAGTVVGSFSKDDSVWHGFTWTPPADAGKK